MNGSNDETRSETKKKAHEKTGQYDHIQAGLLVFLAYLFFWLGKERQEPSAECTMANSNYTTYKYHT